MRPAISTGAGCRSGRKSTAQFFDAPTQRPFLDRLALVQVQYVDTDPRTAPNPLQPLLYIGWLASRLGWALQRTPVEAGRSKNGDILFTFRQGQRMIKVVLQSVAATPEITEGIVSITLATGGPDRATYNIAVSGAACTTTIIDTKTGEPTHRTRAWMAPTEAYLLDHELEIFGHDRVYDEAVSVVAQMIVANPAVREHPTPETDQEQDKTSRRRFFIMVRL